MALQVAPVGVLTILILLCTGPHSCTACLIVPYCSISNSTIVGLFSFRCMTIELIHWFSAGSNHKSRNCFFGNLFKFEQSYKIMFVLYLFLLMKQQVNGDNIQRLLLIQSTIFLIIAFVSLDNYMPKCKYRQ